MGWCCWVILDGLKRTFSGFSSEAAALRGAEVQLTQYAAGKALYTQHDLRQLGLCGAPGSYEAALQGRRARFGIVEPDGGIRRLGLDR